MSQRCIEQPIGVIESGVVIYLVYEALVLITQPIIFKRPPGAMHGYAVLEGFHISEVGLGVAFAVLAVAVGVGTLLQMRYRTKWAQIIRIAGLLCTSIVTTFLAFTFIYDYPNMLTGALIGLAVVIVLASINSIIALRARFYN